MYLLGDVDSSFFTAEELQALAKVVSDGAGLAMLGGFHTFGPGGYSDTPLADLLPVQMDSKERQRVGDAIRSDVQLPGPLRMRPTKPLGQRHYLMAIADAADRAVIWEKLPPLEGANKLGRPKPAAQVLAETPDGKPLLVVQEAGGRVMAFAGDTTWHWWMEGFESQHKRFWRQVVLWLARKDELTDGSVWVKLSQRRFGPRQRVDFTAGAQSPQGEARTDLQFQAEITLPDGGKQKVNVVRQGDHVSGAFDATQAAGDYSVTVTAPKHGDADRHRASPVSCVRAGSGTRQCRGRSHAAGKLVGDDQGRWRADAAPEELPDLLRRIQEKPVEVEVEALVKHTPWDTWPFFLLFVGLIGTEWYLRKKWGLA